MSIPRGRSCTCPVHRRWQTVGAQLQQQKDLLGIYAWDLSGLYYLPCTLYIPNHAISQHTYGVSFNYFLHFKEEVTKARDTKSFAWKVIQLVSGRAQVAWIALDPPSDPPGTSECFSYYPRSCAYLLFPPFSCFQGPRGDPKWAEMDDMWSPRQ